MLACLSIQAQGIIVVTPTTSPVPDIYYSAGAALEKSVDIDGDGTADFIFTSSPSGNADLIPLGNNYFVAGPSYGIDLSNGNLLYDGSLVAALPEGTVIGPTLPVVLQRETDELVWYDKRYDNFGYATITASMDIGEISNFRYLTSAYIGFDLVKNGANYYGWMRVDSPFPDVPFLAISGYITQWAYQSTTDTPILAGQATCTPIKISPVSHSSFVRLDWPSAVGNTFQVQYKEQLAAANWSNMDFAVTATGTNTTINLPTKSSACFYRVVQIILGE